MRQGGFKPKGHNSGTYWVRANAQTGGRKKKTKQKVGVDTNGDGKIDSYVDVNSELVKRDEERTSVDGNPHPLLQWGVSLVLVVAIVIWFFLTYGFA